MSVCILFNSKTNNFVCYYNIDIMTCITSKKLEECISTIKKDIKNYNNRGPGSSYISENDIEISYLDQGENQKKWYKIKYKNLNKFYHMTF